MHILVILSYYPIYVGVFGEAVVQHLLALYNQVMDNDTQ